MEALKYAQLIVMRLFSISVVLFNAPSPIYGGGTIQGAMQFSDISNEVGIHYQHITGAFLVERKNENGTTHFEESRFMPETMGSGIVLFDYDNDNDLDIFINNSSSFAPNEKDTSPSQLALYENMGGWKFKNRSKKLEKIQHLKHGMGAIAADYDGDGYQDLLITGLGGPKLYKNIKAQYFKDVSHSVGISPAYWQDNRGYEGLTWSTGAVFFDVDDDLDLDLLVINYVKWSPEADIYTTYDAVNKGYTSPRSYEGTEPQLFIQNKGVFKEKKNFLDSPTNLKGKSLGVALWDFNQDNQLDVVIANDTCLLYTSPSPRDRG